MVLLIVPAVWILLLGLITALCVAARRGDNGTTLEASEAARAAPAAFTR